MRQGSEFSKNAVGGAPFQIIKSVGIALVFSLFFSVSDKVIYPVNQAVKVLAVFVGCLAGVRGEKGWIKGVGVGLLFTALSYLAFSCVGGDFSLSWLILAETAIGAVAGALSGAISVNLRRI